jgi:hypothetical protein
MKSFLILFALAFSLSAWAQNPPVMETNTPPNAPVTGCPPGFTHSASGWFCDYTTIALHHQDSVYLRIQPSDIDSGDTNGGVPTFNGWPTADAKFKYYALYSGSLNTITSITNSGTVTTVTMTGSNPFPGGVGAPICIADDSVAAYNACFPSISTVTYSGNFLTSFTFAQVGSFASGTGGEVAFGCGDLLPGRSGASKCSISFLVQHHQNNLTTASTSSYIASQAWANSSAPQRTNSVLVGLRDSITVGTHYYHNVTAGGNCTTASTNPGNFSTSGGTSIDGTCTWQDDGLNALPQEALCANNYSGTLNDANVAITAGTIININSSNAVTPPFSTLDVMTCMPIWTERPWRAWFTLFNDTANEGQGNPGIIYHYAHVPWTSQIDYVAVGLQDLSEIFGWNNDKVATLTGMTFNQYLAAFVDDYAGSSFKNNYAAWLGAGSPKMQINTRTNSCSTCNSLGTALIYASEVVKMAKAANPNYSFGNQGISIPWLTVNVNGTWSTANTGFLTPVLDQYRNEKKTVFHHLQTVTAGDCPTVAGLATIGTTQATECTAGQITQGSLALWMPFAVQHGASIFELFNTEILCTWDPNYTVANGLSLGAQPTYPDCQTDNYQTYWNNAAQGLPASTSSQN